MAEGEWLDTLLCRSPAVTLMMHRGFGSSRGVDGRRSLDAAGGTIVICDDVSASLTEDGVFTLEGVRYHLTASSFPWRRALNLFLLLSSARKGEYSGKVRVVNERSDKAIRYAKFLAPFEDDNELLAIHVDLGNCAFPEAGQYNFEISFSTRGGVEVLKGEHPFFVLSYKE